MDFDQAIETQRLRLLRILAGLTVVLGVLAVGPISRGFSASVCSFVGSVLSRAEAAVRYLVIAQARSLASRNGIEIDPMRLSARLARVRVAEKKDLSASGSRRRVKRLRVILLRISRHVERLLRRITKRERSAEPVSPPLRRVERSAPLFSWQLARIRIERPPDKRCSAAPFTPPPPVRRREAFVVGLTTS